MCKDMHAYCELTTNSAVQIYMHIYLFISHLSLADYIQNVLNLNNSSA